MSTSAISGGVSTPAAASDEQLAAAGRALSIPPVSAAQTMPYLDLGLGRSTVGRLGISAPKNAALSSVVAAQVLAENEKLRIVNEGTRNGALSARIRAIAAESPSVAEMLARLEDEAAVLENDIATLDTWKQGLQASLQTRQVESTSLGGRIVAAQAAVDTQAERLRDARNRLTALDSGATQAERQAIEREIAALTDGLVPLEAALAALNGEKERADADIANLDAGLTATIDEITRQEALLAGKNAEFQFLQAGGTPTNVSAEKAQLRNRVLSNGASAALNDLILEKMLEELDAAERAANQPVHWGHTAEERATQYQDNGVKRRAAVYGDARSPDIARHAERLALSIGGIIDALSMLTADVSENRNTRVRLDL
ncbi:cell division protein FtsB [Pseudochelatococcus lubricantis]|uniref:Cell division protein FtsB n=1 Tax=Pseudochelatococcus lubricantis TaxID=1538102 RepID=A0ABX0V037_9HYPH|nr:hypothetical protein [Pseudochelatococcus lubricantis]NIJ58523.1 cell division protein FtsB [Pseudochelatococcus lubricantis]